jgi:hypothetical protein
MTLIIKDVIDEDILMFCAFRYALGRRTYVVGSIVKILLDNWNTLSPTQQELYKKEIRAAIMKDRAGMQMDIDEWNKILALDCGESDE